MLLLMRLGYIYMDVVQQKVMIIICITLIWIIEKNFEILGIIRNWWYKLIISIIKYFCELK